MGKISTFLNMNWFVGLFLTFLIVVTFAVIVFNRNKIVEFVKERFGE
jgi:hypothetical protein